MMRHREQDSEIKRQLGQYPNSFADSLDSNSSVTDET
jgi:hypothetical protein